MSYLPDPGAIGMNVLGAFQAGQQTRRENEARNALSALAMNPGDQQAMGNLAQANPQAAFAMQDRFAQQRAAQQQAERENLVRTLTSRAAQGDDKALVALWAEDPAMAMKLDDRQAGMMADGYEYIAQAALAIDQLPEEQRAAAWDQYVDRGVQMGLDGLERFRGQYSPQALQAAVAKAGSMGDLLGNRQPKYMAIPQGGTLVDTRNPEAVQQFAPQPYNPAEWEVVEEGSAGNGGGGFP